MVLKKQEILWAEFGCDRFPSTTRKDELALATGNSRDQINMWFQRALSPLRGHTASPPRPHCTPSLADTRSAAKKKKAAVAAAAASAAAATASSSPAARTIDATDEPGAPSVGINALAGYPYPLARPPALVSLAFGAAQAAHTLPGRAAVGWGGRAVGNGLVRLLADAYCLPTSRRQIAG